MLSFGRSSCSVPVCFIGWLFASLLWLAPAAGNRQRRFDHDYLVRFVSVRRSRVVTGAQRPCEQVRKDLASAELLYRMGLEENPEHVGILYNFRCTLNSEQDADG